MNNLHTPLNPPSKKSALSFHDQICRVCNMYFPSFTTSASPIVGFSVQELDEMFYVFDTQYYVIRQNSGKNARFTNFAPNEARLNGFAKPG
ncbi:hypothetical protein B5M42_019720 [Paenibacillus athensensis]|uniref:hypothetical protein n=1 Tax=Paenibacillus athensensis TaxID=1967502 RepID=UPI00106F6492|nr:hypothetical protein [Paenibacillus athensensis]MCD1261036.1 hypothetical protein [Paenibacillus athensensis]